MKTTPGVIFLLLAACVKGSGSEIGPAVPDFPTKTVSGQVLAPDGSPIVGAKVELEEALFGNEAVTDRRGRFRFFETPDGDYTLSVDGRRGAANGVGEKFPKFRIPVTVSGETHIPFPIVLPDLDPDPNLAASKTVEIGATLGAGDDIALAGAGVTLVLNGATVEWEDPSAHPGDETAKITVAVVATDELPVPLVSSADGPLAASVVLWIEPGDLVFSDPAGLTHDSSFFPNGASGIGLYRYDLAADDWEKAGAATVAGGTITASGLVAASSFVALAASCSGSTTIAGRVLDAAEQPLAGALVTAPTGKRATTASDGTFSISGVCAEDGNGAAQNGTIHFTSSTSQFPVAAEETPALVPGGTTSLGDVKLRTEASGRVDLILIQKGAAVTDREIAVGSQAASFGSRLKTDSSGIASLFDVPVVSGATFQMFSSSLDDSTSPPAVEAGGALFGFGGLFGGSLFLGSAGNFTFNTLGTSLLVTVLREDSEAPIENAFVLVGLDPSTALQGFTNSSGQIVFSVSGSPTVTAGVQTTAVAGGGGFDLVRMTAYQTVEGVASNSIVIRLPVAQRLGALTTPFQPFGRIAGSASGLTNPLSTPPANPSGTYAVDLFASPAGDARQLFPVFGERSDFDGPYPIGPDPDVGYSSGGALNASYSIAAPAPSAFLLAVERDSASETSGEVVRFGAAGPFSVEAGATASANLSLDFANGASAIALSATGLAGSLEAFLDADLGLELSTGKGFLLGDWTDELSFDASAGSGSLEAATLSGALAGAAYRLALSAEEDAGGIFRRQAAFFGGASGTFSGKFLAVPAFATPTPGGGDFDPTGSGVLWSGSGSSLVDRLRVTFSESVVESGVSIRDDFEWRYFTEGDDGSAVFPELPASSGGKAVPAFFNSGNDYTLEIRSLSAQLFAYQAYFVNAARVRLSELLPTAESIYRANAAVP